MLRSLVIGCGSIGFRHIGHLLNLGVGEVEATDPEPNARRRVLERYGIAASADSFKALERQPDIVLVCTPAHLHISTAIDALRAGSHVFIEKPLATSLDETSALLEIAQNTGKTVQIGYNLRYHPALKTMKQLVYTGALGKVLSAHAEFGFYLDKWWPNRDYRLSYMARPQHAGGLLMDASHEIDSLLWFLGGVERVTGFGGKLSNLEIDGTDTLKISMKMKSGAIASLHLDCLQPTYTREYTLIGENTRLNWDCPSGRADNSLGRLVIFDSDAQKFKRVRMKGRPEDTYVEELRDFLHCVENGTKPLVGLEEGIEVLRVINAIQRSILTGQEVTV